MSDKSIIPQWGSAAQVWTATEQMQKIELARASNRAMIDNLANGGSPYSPDEKKKYGIEVNVNFLMLTRKLQDATGQINNAFIPAGQYFTATCTRGKEEKRQEWGQKYTKNFNELLKRGKSGRRHHFLMRTRNASVALHGIGPLLWSNDYRLLPRYVPLEDLLIPTDTLLDQSNNSHLAVNLYLTPGELYRMALMGPEDPAWDKKAVLQIMEKIRDDKWAPYWPPNDDTWYQRPEAVQELWRQNSGYWQSDSVQKCKLRAFYYEDPTTGKWWRKIIQRDGFTTSPPDSFLYDGKRPFADDIGHILHCQFGDNSLVPPLKYHSVRGIGQMLYGACEALNRLQCRGLQSIFQDLLNIYKIQNPTDTDRAKLINIFNNSVLPEGVGIVTAAERHQPNPTLFEMGVGLLNQNIAEGSASFTQQSGSSGKEMTAREAMIRLSQANAMVGNVLSMMYAQEIFYYEELKRRASKENSPDPTVQRFQKKCIADGIPAEYVTDADCWHLVAERVLGSGDSVLASAQADALMSQRMTFDPKAQREILRMWTSTTTDNPDLAQNLVPDAPDQSTSGTLAAEDVFGTLMQGIQIPPRQGIDQVGYCGSLIDMMTAKIKPIVESDGMGTPELVVGLLTVGQTAEQSLQILSGDENMKPIVKALNDQLGQNMNEVKAMIQRQQEAAGEQMSQQDIEAQAKASSIVLLAQTKAQISERQATQKMQLKQQQFEQAQSHKFEQHMQKMKQEMDSHFQKLNQQKQQTDADITAKGLQVGADVQATSITATAKADATKKTAAQKESKQPS